MKAQKQWKILWESKLLQSTYCQLEPLQFDETSWWSPNNHDFFQNLKMFSISTREVLWVLLTDFYYNKCWGIYEICECMDLRARLSLITCKIEKSNLLHFLHFRKKYGVFLIALDNTGQLLILLCFRKNLRLFLRHWRNVVFLNFFLFQWWNSHIYRRKIEWFYEVWRMTCELWKILKNCSECKWLAPHNFMKKS